MTKVSDRRTFIASLALVGCESTRRSTSDKVNSAQSSPKPKGPTTDRTAPRTTPDTARDDPGSTSGVPTRAFGGSDERVSLVGLGGYHLGIPSEAEAIRIMHRAIDDGITFFDNCWDYHDGESERRMGKALEAGQRRDKVFLMTKLDGRTKESARLQLEDSLRRLKTDRIDLVQVHEVIREEDPEWVFGDDGAIAALKEARDAGKIRFVGFTGHKSPEIHLEMLEVAKAHDFHFDAVQMPLNVMDVHYRSFQRRVLPVLKDKGIAVLGMKPLASGDILQSNLVSAEECLRYALSLPTSVVITGCDSMSVYEQALRVARSFEPFSRQQLQALEHKTRAAGQEGRWEAFKNTQRFDATARNPRWLTSNDI